MLMPVEVGEQLMGVGSLYHVGSSYKLMILLPQFPNATITGMPPNPAPFFFLNLQNIIKKYSRGGLRVHLCLQQ